MGAVGPAHVPVARLLGQHRRGGDRRALGISANDRALLVGQLGNREAIAQADAAAARDLGQGITQRRQIRLVQTSGVDPGGAAGDDRHPCRQAEDHRVQRRPSFGRLLLGVVQRPQCPSLRRAQAVEIEQDAGCHQRTGQAPPPRLVGAGDEANAEPTVEAEQLAAGTARPAA